MSDIPPIPSAQLKLVVTDPDELSKGLAIADKGGLKHLARYGNKLFAEADGSGSTPYKVQIVHDGEKGYRGRCSCMAARTRPFCKHAAALMAERPPGPPTEAQLAGWESEAHRDAFAAVRLRFRR